MKKILPSALALLLLPYSFVGADTVEIESLFTQSQELSSDYIMATYGYANSVLGVSQKELSQDFNWSVTTGDLTYYWNSGTDPVGTPDGDITASYLQGAPRVNFTIPSWGTEVSLSSPFTVNLEDSSKSTVTPGVTLSQEIVGANNYDTLVHSLETQQTLLSAESGLQRAKISLEIDVLEAIKDLFNAQLAYAQGEKTLEDAELNMENVSTVLGYTETSITYQESAMALLQAEQNLSNKSYELMQAEDSLELLTGVRTVTFDTLELPNPELSFDELRATTSLMAAEIDLSLAEVEVAQLESATGFTLDGTFDARLTVGDGQVTNPTISTGLEASLQGGFSLGVSASTNLDKNDFTGGLSFTYMPQVGESSTISLDQVKNGLLLTMEQKRVSQTLYENQQSQLQNQIDLWAKSYDIAQRRYEVAQDQYTHGVSLFEQGYSSHTDLQERELTLLEAQNQVMQSILQGLQLERSIELFYHS